MKVRDLVREVDEFQQALLKHRELYAQSLNPVIPGYPEKDFEELTKQSRHLGRTAGRLRPFLERLRPGWVARFGGGPLIETLEAATGMAYVAQIKGESLDLVTAAIDQVIGKLQGLDPDDDVPADPGRPISTSDELARVSEYRTAMVCEKGHLITGSLEDEPAKKASHCPKCGTKTLASCTRCGEAIRGYYKVSGKTDLTGFVAPVLAFCHACGNPYPWTMSAKRAWRELVEESDVLSEEEKERLSGSIDDLIADTPGTDVAITRVKKWLSKTGNVAGPSVRQIIVTLATEYVKKAMGV